MTEIEKIKQEIEVLTAKLALLEEIENHMEQEIQKAFDKVCDGFHPNLSGDRFDFFKWGYEDGYKAHQSLDDDANKMIKPSMFNCVLEGNPPDGHSYWNEWFREIGSKGILHNLKLSSLDNKEKHFQPTPQTPEEVAEGLRNAMRQAKEEGVFDKPTKPMDEVVDRMVKKYQAQKLWNRVRDELGYSIDLCDEIVDLVEEWIPEPQSAAGSQNIDVEFLVEGFNDCVRKMKEMLR